jgi:hypothetical protein
VTRHAKASSAGPNSGGGNSLGSIRRAFATRGASSDANGSGAHSVEPRRLVAVLGFALLLCGLAMALSAGAQASKVVYDSFGNPTTTAPTGTAVDGGLFNTPRGVAVNAAGTGGVAAGDVYVVNSTANRIDQFSSKGAFIRAFGRDVIEEGKPNSNGTGYEICDTTAGNSPADCQAGAITPQEGGTLSTPQGIAINQTTGHLYVSDQSLLRVDEFDATGHFVRAFGAGVVDGGATGTGAITNGSSEVTSVVTTSKAFLVGQRVTGEGIPANATITAVTTGAGAASKLVLSQPATETKSTTLTVAEGAGNNATNEVQVVTIPATATSGNFKLKFTTTSPTAEGTTANIPYNATPAEVQAALELLTATGLGAGKVSVTSSNPGGGASAGGPYTVEFKGTRFADTNVNQMTQVAGSPALSTGTAAIATTVEGASSPEVCTQAAACKTGVTSTLGGGFASTFNGYPAVAPAGSPSQGNVIIPDPGNRRVEEFASNGTFVRAFGQDVVSSGVDNSSVNEQQTVTITADGGTFTLSFNPGNGSQTSGAIKYNATPSEVETALNSLSNMVAVGATVSVSGGPGNATGSNPYTITFGGTQVGNDVASLTASATNLTLSTGTKSASVATPTQGGAFEICKAASSDVCRVGGTSGSGVGQFGTNGPNRVAVDSTGAIYTLEQASPNFRVQKFAPTGSSLTPALFNPPIGVAPTVFLAGSSATDTPTDIAIGASDHVFVIKACSPTASCPNAGAKSERRIYEFDSTGNLIDTHIAGGGIESANGLAVNPTSGRLYLSSTASPGHRVYIIADPPGSAPVVTTGGSAEGPNFALRTLEGTVNPSGFKVKDCHFAYGPTAEYGATTPCVPAAAALGDGSGDVAVTAPTEPLEPNTVYHYRLLASNVGSSSQGKDRTFTTGAAPPDNCPNAAIRAEQGVEALQLPDCMALEQVSPPVKGNQHARLPSVSANGERVAFNSQATLTDEAPNRNGLGGDTYIATRGPSGWTTKPQGPPVQITGSGGQSFSPDFSSWIWGGADRLYQQTIGGSLTQLTPPLVNSISEFPFPGFQGASADHSHVYLQPGVGGTEAAYLPGDPAPSGAAPDSNTYVGHLDAEGHPTLELMARDRTGKVWGGNCGSRIGGTRATSGSNLYLKNGTRVQGAISPDGSHVYFSLRPSQPETGPCLATSRMRIMVREETSTGPTIEELFHSECTRVSPPCQDVGDDVYQGASLDQTKVYFLSNRQLTNDDLDGTTASCANESSVPGCDLYLYDATKPEGERLTDVSAGDATDPTPGVGANLTNSITAISADGSHVYFVARSILTTNPNPNGDVAQAGAKNLYAYDALTEKLSFVGKLDEEDGGGPFPKFALYGSSPTWSNDAYPVPIKGTDAQGREVGGDGHILVFRTKARLTPDDTDSARDIYRYNAEAGTLERISAAGPGPVGNAEIDVEKNTSSGGGGTDYGERGRWVSEDGETILFTTAEGLLPGDVNGLEDVYMWRHGHLYELPGGTRFNSVLRANTPSMSADGSEIAYHTSKRLLPSDGDSAQDVYVARVNGGFPTPTETECDGEACQGPPAAAPGQTGATTGAFAGAGNVRPESGRKTCPPGKRKVKRKGKARCAPKHRAGKNHQRRNGGRRTSR